MTALASLRLPPAPTVPSEVSKHAAVAIIHGPDDALLFIQRAERQGDLWSGHMAFPGGRADRADASLLHTAMRETREEVGLDLSDATCLGALSCQVSPVRDPDGGLGIFPFVFAVDRWPAFTLSDEVAAVHPISLARLVAGEGRATFPYRWREADLDLPCIRLEDRLIWGLSLRMLDELLARLGGPR